MDRGRGRDPHQRSDPNGEQMVVHKQAAAGPFGERGEEPIQLHRQSQWGSQEASRYLREPVDDSGEPSAHPSSPEG